MNHAHPHPRPRPRPERIVRFIPLDPLRFAAVADLARRIWPVCFADVISPAQCEYMLASRYTPEAIARSLEQGMRYELLELDDQGPIGFGAHGPADDPRTWKLWQVYTLPEWQGHGFGTQFIHHVTEVAQQEGSQSLVLTVNRRNHRAKSLYERHGFTVRETARFDIGNGFVMDDYVMVKPLT